MRLIALATAALLSFSSQIYAASAAHPVIEEYLKIQESLALDSLEGISAAATTISKEASGSGLKDKKLANQIAQAATALAKAKTIKEARAGFKKLSAPTVQWVKESKPSDVEIVHCPMAGASWLQKKGEVRNPYFGKSMLECGEKVS